MIIDAVNLLLALLGIWRTRFARGGIWNLLYRQVQLPVVILSCLAPDKCPWIQGVIWIFVAVLMYCVPLVRHICAYMLR